MFLHLFNTVLEKIYKQTKLPTVICPQASSSDTCILPCFFTWFSNGTTGPKQPIKSTKSKFVTPKVGELAKSEVKVLHFCVVLPALQKTNNEPEKQKTKKPRNQKNKKTKKNKIAHPKGGVVAESWVLSFCVFFVFLFFGFLVSWFIVFCGFWFWLAIAEKPSRNCQWLQSSERTIADAVVAKMCSFSGCRMQWKTALPRCPLLFIYIYIYWYIYTYIYIYIYVCMYINTRIYIIRENNGTVVGWIMLKIPISESCHGPFSDLALPDSWRLHGSGGCWLPGCGFNELLGWTDGHHPVMICGHPSEMFRVTANPAAAKIQVTAVSPTTPDRLDHT